MKKTFYILLLCSATFLASCYYDNFAELNPGAELNQVCDTTGTISFATQVQPILANSCNSGSASCHAAGAISGWDLSDYAGVVNSANNTLVSSIIWDGNASQMPKNSPTKIDDCSSVTIQLWVSQGMLNN